MKKATRKTRSVKARAVKTKTQAFYKAPLDFVSSGFNSFVSYFK